MLVGLISRRQPPGWGVEEGSGGWVQWALTRLGWAEVNPDNKAGRNVTKEKRPHGEKEEVSGRENVGGSAQREGNLDTEGKGKEAAGEGGCVWKHREEYREHRVAGCAEREGQRESPAGVAAFSESRGNLAEQGIFKGECVGRGPRLCVEHTWCHPIKPAHITDFLLPSHCRGHCTVLLALPPLNPARRQHHMGFLMFPCEEVQRISSPPLSPPRLSFQGRSSSWRHMV